MNDSERLALVASVVAMLRSAGSWTGRMHIQKLIYIGQEFGIVSPAYEFVLYQRGPYSFDLDSDIRELRSIGAVDIRPAPPYGPTYVTTGIGALMAEASPVREDAAVKLGELAGKLGSKQAKDLELLATTLFVIEEGNDVKEDIIDRVTELKPHFDREAIEGAIREVEELQSQFSVA